MVAAFASRGWAAIAPDAGREAWRVAARIAAQRAVRDPELAHWHQCEGTWFVGVDALPNAPDGRLPDGPALTTTALGPLGRLTGPLPDLHPAQLSVIYPGYPKPRLGEGEAAFRYRRNRDAAHVDGVMATGPDRRRKVQEPHAFVLGLPLTEASADAAPMVIWEGSHQIMRAAFSAAFANHPPETWADIDVTDVYQAARREVFERCPRVAIHVPPGGAFLLHRLALHGVGPWGAAATASRDGRMIAYFRPLMPGGVPAWVNLP